MSLSSMETRVVDINSESVVNRAKATKWLEIVWIFRDELEKLMLKLQRSNTV